MLAGQPVLILREGSQHTERADARKEILRSARAAADALRSTLGPRGLDKMLISSVGDVVVTNDGATILQKMEVLHPAAKILVEVAKAQDQECGDGTKSAAIFAGELLRKAEELLDDRLHPTTITQGYQVAAEKARAYLDELGKPVRRADEVRLRQIAATAMISKGVSGHRDLLSGLAVRAVLEAADELNGRITFDKKNVQFVTRQGGELSDSELIEGHIVEKERVNARMPPAVEEARIALLELPLEVRKTEFTAEIRITEAQQVQSFLTEEDRTLQAMVDAVARAGANVLFAEKGIADLAADHLARRGIYAVSRVSRRDLELLARATGGVIVARAEDLAPATLGQARRVEERKVGEGRLTFVTGCPRAKAVTLLVRGGTEHVVKEAERSLVDAVAVVALALEDGRVVTGAGASALELAVRLRDFADTIGGREQLAVRAFAEALEVIPETLAVNAGMDPIDTLVELRRRHRSGERDVGVDVLHGRVGDMSEIAVEPVRVGRQEILSATEATTVLLRIDDVISSRPSGTHGGPAPGGPAGAGEFR